MKTINSYVLDMARNAQTLYERLNFIPEKPVHSVGTEKTERRLRQWKEYAAANDNLAFAKRLTWDGLDEQTALQLMADAMPGQGQQASPWMTLLEEVLGQAGCVTADELRNSPHAFKDKKHPFEDIHMLFANTGIKRLYERYGKINDLFTPQAFTDLVRFLLLRLSFVSADVLQTEMELGNGEYSSFIDGLLEGELLKVFGKYPVMARLMSQFTLFWVDVSAQLLNALADDMDSISETFGGHRHPGRVKRVECGLSDSHNGGRSVVKLEFENKLKLIFKPRDLGIEESFFHFAAQMNALEDDDMFRVLKILNRGSHGWVEYCEQLPCRDEREVSSFYRRSGMLLCVMYLLAGGDLHHENIIAQGEYPVAVDMEVMLQALPEHEKLPGEHSVLGTSLLPVQFFQDHNGCFSFAGLGGGRNAEQEEYLEDIEAGFIKAYKAIRRHGDRLLSAAGPLSMFENKRVRYVFRKTELYFRILYNSVRPQYQENGILRSIRLDKISRTLVSDGKKPSHWDIIRLEHEAFDRGDIPIFYSNTCGRQLENENGSVIENFFTDTPMAALKCRISGMNDDDLAKQCALIRESFRVKAAVMRDSKSQAAECTIDKKQHVCTTNQEQLQLLEAAKTIAGYICDRAIVTGASVTWPNTVEGINPYIELNVMNDNLYNGKVGVCLFLSACLKVLGGQANIGFLQTQLVSEMFKTADRVQQGALRIGRIGAGKGIGGIVYALVKMWEFTADELLLRKALQLSQTISDQLIANDVEYDVISGSAGAILGLLALYGICPSDEVLQRAVKCADHLLECRVEGSNGFKAWKPSGMFTLDNQPVPAFSRGASGIALALGRLYKVSGQMRYMQAAREAVWYENDILQEQEYAWPGLKGQNAEIQLSWCTGAAGICLNRLEAGDIIGFERKNSDLKASLNLISCAGDLNRDNISWGNFGLIDVLVTASYKLDDGKLYHEAFKRASRYSEDCYSADFYSTIHDLSFFNGISGIGYVLLRLVDRQLPSILAFD